MKKPSIKDVARLSGYSSATVSLALRDSDQILPATKEKVLRAAAQLNYRPNLTARRLSSKSSRVVGIILLPLQHDEGLQMLYGITEHLQEYGFRSLIEFTGMNYDLEVEAVERFIDEGVDGVLVNSAVVSEEPRHLLELQRHGIPFVQMDLRVAGIDSSYVGIHNERGSFHAVQHLIDAGHRRIACVGRLFRRNTKRERLEGYRRALIDNGLTADPDLLLDKVCVSLADYVQAGKNKESRKRPIEAQVQEALHDTRADFVRALRRLLALDDPPTAFFTVDSGALFSLLSGLRELGVAVPDDVSIVTFEPIPYLSSLDVRVTTVTVPAYQIGYEASRLLVKHIEHGGEAQSIRLEPEFIGGNTVAPPSGR